MRSQVNKNIMLLVKNTNNGGVWNLNEQNVALPMQNNVNGQTKGTSFQPGTTR